MDASIPLTTNATGTLRGSISQGSGESKDGNLLISVHTEDRTERARARTIFEQAGAEEIADTAEARV